MSHVSLNVTHQGHNMIYIVFQEFNLILATKKQFGPIQIAVGTKKASLNFSRTHTHTKERKGKKKLNNYSRLKGFKEAAQVNAMCSLW